MSTCSTATSARRRVVPPACDAAEVDAVVHGRLERRLVDLEQDWDAYKSGRRSSPPPRRRRRRSRSATGTPSSAVTVAAAPDDGLLLPLYRCSSPRRTLVSSLQQAGSGAADSDGAAGSPTRSYQQDLSSVCSVEEAAPFSSCSCCPCLYAVCCGGNSASSSCAGATAPPFPSSAGGIVVEDHATKSDEGRSVAGKVGWVSAIALFVIGFLAMAVLELGVDEGCAEYLVPT